MGKLKKPSTIQPSTIRIKPSQFKICSNVDCFTNRKDLARHYAYSRTNSLLEEHQILQTLYLKSIEERYRRGLIFAELYLYEKNQTQAIYESLNELYK